MKNDFPMQSQLLISQLASISASLKVGFEFQINDLPTGQKRYWLDRHRLEEVKVLLTVLQLNSLPGASEVYKRLADEMSQLSIRIEKYHSGRKPPKPHDA